MALPQNCGGPGVIRELLKAGDYEGAMKWVDNSFLENPEDDGAAFYFAHLMLESEHPGVAKFVLEHLVERNPDKHQAWLHLGAALTELGLYDEAEKAVNRSNELKPSPGARLALANIATNKHEWERAIELSDSKELQADINKAFAYLALGRYGEGWDLYERGVGYMKWRDRHDYGLKDWRGERGKVVFYAEQGIGDQIAFCSALPDAIRDGVVAAVNCHPKLVNLFRDSFDVPVFGDQFNQELAWPSQVGAEYQAPMCALQRHYRRKKEHYHGKPFLKPNAGKEIQWKALLDTLSDKPKIGIAWNGGFSGSYSWRTKSVDLGWFRPLMDRIDAEWIDLEYKPHNEKIHSFPWGTQTADYSDTVALVSALDAVVCVPTAVYHAAGGLGVPAWVMLQDRPHFHERTGYYGSVRFRPRSGVDFDQLAGEILNEVQRSDPGRPGARGDEGPRHRQRANGHALQHGAV